jgi:short-subunit dehydrogenase involved in D-alanine esterification of teichoic acids
LLVGGDVFIAKRKEEHPLAEKTDGNIIGLGDLESVQKFAAYVNGKYTTIDVLLLKNAGVMITPA